MTTTEYHVTRVTRTDVFGHETRYCNESGCSGNEKWLGPVDTMRNEDFGPVTKGAVVELEDPAPRDERGEETP